MKVTNSLEIPRFSGIRSFMRLPLGDENKTDISLVGVPFDSAVSFRPGTRFGPAALREASLILKPYCSVLDTNIFENLTLADYGDFPTVPGYIEESLNLIESNLRPYLAKGSIPIVMGGDHLITLPELRAVHKELGPVALLHFDAHSDTVPEYFGKPYNHGSPFYHALNEGLIIPEKSMQIGIRGPLYDRNILNYPKEKGMRIVMGEELHNRGMDAVIKEAVERIGNTPTFLTFDIDFLDAAYAPGTGTPEVEGFSTHQALYMVRRIAKELNIIAMDLVEVLPDKDSSGITALAGVSVIHAVMAAISYRKQHNLK